MSATQPSPTLPFSAGQCTLPLWLSADFSQGRPRQRLSAVSSRPPSWILQHPSLTPLTLPTPLWTVPSLNYLQIPAEFILCPARTLTDKVGALIFLCWKWWNRLRKADLQKVTAREEKEREEMSTLLGLSLLPKNYAHSKRKPKYACGVFLYSVFSYLWLLSLPL